MSTVALVHDYLTQRGGAERVVLSLARAFPNAALYTSLYEPQETFPEFAGVDVRPMALNHIRPLRRRHRLALPLLAPAFGRLRIEDEVVICSSSGWAHGAHVEGRKIVYCHTPARWLYQPDRYLRGRGVGQRVLASLGRSSLIRWDRSAAQSADRYLANSTVVAKRIEHLYGIEAEVVPPPPAVTPHGPSSPVAGQDGGFVLCVSRLLPYKNVDAVVRAFSALPAERLVIVGRGPAEHDLRSMAGSNVRFLGQVGDDALRWLYGNCSLLIAASHEDFGLTPVEAASFGKPSLVLKWGGFLDTVDEGRNGVFFDTPDAAVIVNAMRELRSTSWDEGVIRAHASKFAEGRFIERVREVALERA